jgi:hypothetical protein
MSKISNTKILSIIVGAQALAGLFILAVDQLIPLAESTVALTAVSI